MNIDAAYVGQMVVLPGGENGCVAAIDHDENEVTVDVAVAAGIDRISIDPSEIEPKD